MIELKNVNFEQEFIDYHSTNPNATLEEFVLHLVNTNAIEADDKLNEIEESKSKVGKCYKITNKSCKQIDYIRIISYNTPSNRFNVEKIYCDNYNGMYANNIIDDNFTFETYHNKSNFIEEISEERFANAVELYKEIEYKYSDLIHYI